MVKIKISQQSKKRLLVSLWSVYCNKTRILPFGIIKNFESKIKSVRFKEIEKLGAEKDKKSILKQEGIVPLVHLPLNRPLLLPLAKFKLKLKNAIKKAKKRKAKKKTENTVLKKRTRSHRSRRSEILENYLKIFLKKPLLKPCRTAAMKKHFKIIWRKGVRIKLKKKKKLKKVTKKVSKKVLKLSAKKNLKKGQKNVLSNKNVKNHNVKKNLKNSLKRDLKSQWTMKENPFVFLFLKKRAKRREKIKVFLRRKKTYNKILFSKLRKIRRTKIYYKNRSKIFSRVKKNTLGYKINISVKANNVFSNLATFPGNKVSHTCTAGKYKTKVSKKNIRFVYNDIITKFFKRIKKKFFKKEKKPLEAFKEEKKRNKKAWRFFLIPRKKSGIIVTIIASTRKRRKLIKNVAYHFKGLPLIIKVLDKKIFNGCRAPKKMRKKRKRMRILK